MFLKKKGRAIAGEKAKLSVAPKGSRISLLAALEESKGYAHYQLFNSAGEKKRGVNANDFQLFVLSLAPKVPHNSVLILDNCRIHHAESLNETWKMLKLTYGIEHIFLPPYSPFLNPIEYSFNVLKENVKSQPFYNRGELISVIERAISTSITSENTKKMVSKK